MYVYLNVENLLKREHKTKYWLVKELNTTYPVINKMIDGSAVAIHLETIGKLCKALNCMPNDLIIIDD